MNDIRQTAPTWSRPARVGRYFFVKDFTHFEDRGTLRRIAVYLAMTLPCLRRTASPS